jgi:hypothetical protein
VWTGPRGPGGAGGAAAFFVDQLKLGPVGPHAMKDVLPKDWTPWVKELQMVEDDFRCVFVGDGHLGNLLSERNRERKARQEIRL